MISGFFDITKHETEGLLSDSYVTTDSARNMIATFRFSEICRIACSCHDLNVFITNLFLFGTKKKPILFEWIDHLLSNACSLVNHAKRSELNKKLPTSLKMEIPTRWNSKLLMLESIYSNYEDIKEQITSQHRSKIDSISKEKVEELITFLKPFERATLALSARKSPTIQKVFLYSMKLKNHIEEFSEKYPEWNNKKDEILELFDQKFHIDPIHLIAVYLDPNFKNLNFMSLCLKAKTLENCKKYCVKYSTNVVGEQTDEIGSNVQSKDDIDDELSCFFSFNSNSQSRKIEDEVQVEINNYERIIIDGKVDNILLFWHEKKSFLPLLHNFFFKIISIQASSVASESLFSSTGQMINDRRVSLLPKNAEKLIFIRSNL